MPKLIVILGPTSSGKSDLAVKIASLFNGEIISADSRQVYRGLNIGSGKITESEMLGIPHHMLDLENPQNVFTVAQYKKKATEVISKIIERGNLPILCGGTGFYIQAVTDNLPIPKVPPNQKLRAKLEKQKVQKLFFELQKKDSRRANQIDPANKRRVIRALEIVKYSGKVPALTTKRIKIYDTLKIGLQLEEQTLKKNIRRRLLKRIAEGMIEEAKQLHKEGLSFERMEELGLEYKFLAKYLKGTIDLQEMMDKLNTEIWRYAKRQKTWFNKDPNIEWFSPEKTTTIFKRVKSFLENTA